MEESHDTYIPALRYDWLTSVYDPLMRWTLREATFKRRLIEQAQIARGHKVLDLGCGTATLSLLVKKLYPDAVVIGIDRDARILGIARAKVAAAGSDMALHHGMAFELPYCDNSFDRVLSSLLFHHLTRENKLLALREVFRVLRPDGELHVADWGKAQNALMRAAFLLVQVLDGFETTADNVNGELPLLISEAGFEGIQQTARYTTLFGTLCLYKAGKPKWLRLAPGRTRE